MNVLLIYATILLNVSVYEDCSIALKNIHSCLSSLLNHEYHDIAFLT